MLLKAVQSDTAFAARMQQLSQEMVASMQENVRIVSYYFCFINMHVYSTCFFSSIRFSILYPPPTHRVPFDMCCTYHYMSSPSFFWTCAAIALRRGLIEHEFLINIVFSLICCTLGLIRCRSLSD